MSEFRDSIIDLMKTVPAGRVTTYGDLASIAGKPMAARQVGGVAHFGLEDVAWHRLVNCEGKMASGFPGGPEVQKQLLEGDGVEIWDMKVVNFSQLRWRFFDEK